MTPSGDGYDVGTPSALGGLPLRVLPSSDGIWVSLFDVGAIQRVDPVTDRPGGLMSRWSLRPDGTRAADGTAQVGLGPRLTAPNGSGVVVSAYSGGTVSAVGRGPRRADQRADLRRPAGAGRRRRPDLGGLHR